MSEAKCANCKCFIKMEDYLPPDKLPGQIPNAGMCRMFPGTPMAVPGQPIGLPYNPIKFENDMCFWFIDKDNAGALPLWLMPLFGDTAGK